MTFAKSEFSRRFTGSEMLRSIPLKQVERDAISAQTAAYEAQGGVIQLCRGVIETPRKEAERKPHPEMRVKAEPTRTFSFKKYIAEGMIPLMEAMPICEFDPLITSQMKAFSSMCDKGDGPKMAHSQRTKGGKTFRFFWPQDCIDWINNVRKARGAK